MGRTSNLQEYINKIKAYHHKYGTIPNFETIAKLLGLNSKGSIHKIFNKLIDMDLFRKEGKSLIPTEKFVSLPVFESVRAGMPDTAKDDIYTNINVQKYLVEDPNETILIKVKGDSMKDAGIVEGDIVVVQKNKKAKIGDIIVAVVDGEYTLKYLMKEKEKYYLRAANSKYSDIYPSEQLNIFGVVRGSMRTY